MNYLLDANACIALIKGKPLSVRAGFQKALDAGDKVFVSSIVASELWHRVAKSSHQEVAAKRLRAFFGGPVIPIAFENEDAEIAGAVRADLKRSGAPIGAYDLLIAGQALRHNLTLVTANQSEFARIKNLVWQDWAISR
jgi:tRNA(fMet)-specific endonuclease VapC